MAALCSVALLAATISGTVDMPGAPHLLQSLSGYLYSACFTFKFINRRTFLFALIQYSISCITFNSYECKVVKVHAISGEVARKW
jgi:hypothetical protein